MKILRALFAICAGCLLGPVFSTAQRNEIPKVPENGQPPIQMLQTNHPQITMQAEDALHRPVQRPSVFKDMLKKKAVQMYSGQERNVHTYVYLYKVPHSENYTDGGCSCNSCDIRKDGLGVGIITTEGELSEMDENSIKIIWSGTSSFVLRKDDWDDWTQSFTEKPYYSFQLAVGQDYLKRRQDESCKDHTFGKEKDKLKSHLGFVDFCKTDDFLRFKGNLVEKGVPTSELELLDYVPRSGDRPDLRAVTVLKNALFRWEIEPSTMTDILTKIGTIGDANNELPKEIIKGYNCTYTANLVLQALGIIPACAQRRNPENLALHAAAHIGTGGLASGIMAMGILGPLTSVAIGVLTGVVTGVMDWWGNHEMTAPKQLVDWILDYHKKLASTPVNQRDAMEPSNRQKIASTFRIIAHNPQPAPQTDEEEVAGMFNYRLGTNFEYKTAQEATEKSITTTEKGGKFLNSQFE